MGEVLDVRSRRRGDVRTCQRCYGAVVSVPLADGAGRVLVDGNRDRGLPVYEKPDGSAIQLVVMGGPVWAPFVSLAAPLLELSDSRAVRKHYCEGEA